MGFLDKMFTNIPSIEKEYEPEPEPEVEIGYSYSYPMPIMASIGLFSRLGDCNVAPDSTCPGYYGNRTVLGVNCCLESHFASFQGTVMWSTAQYIAECRTNHINVI